MHEPRVSAPQDAEVSSARLQPAATPARPAGRLLAVGDIHGCIRPLEAILDSVHLVAGDTLVVLGDFVNRGPATRQVIEQFLHLQASIRLITILGNHEEEMLAARHDQAALARWLAMGGRATLASYEADSLSEIPPEHWAFIESAVPWWETQEFFFTHANYAADVPLADQSSLELRWMALDDQPVRPHMSGKTAIVGHTPNLAGRIVDFGFLRCLDTGCGLGGCLTMMDLESGHSWQCAELSQKVIWNNG